MFLFKIQFRHHSPCTVVLSAPPHKRKVVSLALRGPLSWLLVSLFLSLLLGFLLKGYG